MALYGPNSGVVPFTGFSPTLGPVDAVVPVTSGQVQFDGMTQNDDAFSYLMFRRANGAIKRLLIALTGAASGGTADEHYSRVQAVQALNSITTNGGLVPVEVVSQINRATTAGDVTNLKAMFARSPVVSFVADVSGNGSGNGKGGSGQAY
jgi:hypothetical protein